MSAYILMDHSQGTGIDGKQGIKQECDAEQCTHCGAVIAKVMRGTELYQLSNIDLGLALMAGPQNLSGHYVHHRRCPKHGNICRLCAGVMEQDGGVCGGSLKDRWEKAMSGTEGRLLLATC